MSSPSDPTRSWRSRTRLTWLVGSPAIIAAALWAVLVPDAPVPVVPDLSVEVEQEEAHDAPPLNLAAFDAPLWVEPPVVAERQPEPPPPPVDLQLIAVVQIDSKEAGGKTLQAAIYDPQSDRLHFVTDGEQVGRFTILAVNADGARITDGRREIELFLGDDQS